MKRIIPVSIVIVSIILIFFTINHINYSKKAYKFVTYHRIESKERVDFKSMTKDFHSVVKKMNLDDNIISSNDYSVRMKLNKKQLKKIIENREIKKYFTSYQEYKIIPHSDQLEDNYSMS